MKLVFEGERRVWLFFAIIVINLSEHWSLLVSNVLHVGTHSLQRLARIVRTWNAKNPDFIPRHGAVSGSIQIATDRLICRPAKKQSCKLP